MGIFNRVNDVVQSNIVALCEHEKMNVEISAVKSAVKSTVNLPDKTTSLRS